MPTKKTTAPKTTEKKMVEKSAPKTPEKKVVEKELKVSEKKVVEKELKVSENKVVEKTPEKKVVEVSVPKAPVKKSQKLSEPVVSPQEGKEMLASRKKTPYNFFVSQEMKKLGLMEKFKDVKKSDLMKECGSIWKGMGEEQKAEFVKLAENQEVVMKVKKVKKNKKEKSDKPKKVRAKTPYNFFVSEQMKKLGSMSEWKDKKNSELMKECGVIWKDLKDDSKLKYQKQADEFKLLLVQEQKNLSEVFEKEVQVE